MAAVSAIASHLADLVPDCGRYLAGLWEHSLVGQLCWSTSGNASRARECLAPSWSWVSVRGAVSPHFLDLITAPRHRARAIASVIEATPTHAYSPFVSFTGGTLRVSAPLYRITLAKPKDTKPPVRQPEDKKQLIDISSKAQPGYTGTNLRSVGLSTGGLPTGQSGMQRLDMDPTEGLISMPDSDVTVGPEQPRKSPLRSFEMGLDGIEFGHWQIQTDEDFTREELGRLKPVFMPVFYTFERTFPEIDTLRGLVLAVRGDWVLPEDWERHAGRRLVDAVSVQLGESRA